MESVERVRNKNAEKERKKNLPRLDNIGRGSEVGSRHASPCTCQKQLTQANWMLFGIIEDVALQMSVDREVDAREGNVAQKTSSHSPVKSKQAQLADNLQG